MIIHSHKHQIIASNPDSNQHYKTTPITPNAVAPIISDYTSARIKIKGQNKARVNTLLDEISSNPQRKLKI